jgi:AmiR/NasT family two-component response regulator
VLAHPCGCVTPPIGALAAQLQAVLASRVAIEQAKGRLAQHRSISVEDAFEILRGHARDHNLRLSDVARSAASRELALDRSSTTEP